MVAGVQPGCVQSDLLGETASASKSASKSEVEGVDSMSSTQVPASESTMKRCWNAVIDAARAILRVLSGIPRWIWDCMSAPSRSEVGVNEVGVNEVGVNKVDVNKVDVNKVDVNKVDVNEVGVNEVGVSRVDDFMELARLFRLLDESILSPSETENLHTQVRTAYDKLDSLRKQTLQTDILGHVENDDNMKDIIGEDGTVDMIDVSRFLHMDRVIIRIAKTFPVSNESV